MYINELHTKITRIILEKYSKNPTFSHKDPQKTIESVAETIEIRRLQVFTPLGLNLQSKFLLAAEGFETNHR